MLEKVHFDEAKQSQLPAVEILLALGYEYVSTERALAERKGDTGKYLLQDIAFQKLMEINSYEVEGEKYSFTEKEVRDALSDLEREQYGGLMSTAQDIFHMIMPTSGGKTIRVNVKGKESSQNFRFVDFENIKNNSFHVTVEYTVTGKQSIRPDIVCFVNGIPFAVIENKKSSVAVSEALSQMNRNQGVEYCPKFFAYTQLLVGTNGKELQYGTTGTPNKFYAIWKEKEASLENLNEHVKTLIASKVDEVVYEEILKDLNGYTNGYKQKLERIPTEQDRGIVALFAPERLLDLTKNYTVFDGGVKKLSRYQQFFAIHKMLTRISEKEVTQSGIARRRGGLVWHTQGSGKSLTMVMFVKMLIEHKAIKNPRVIIVTDRKDLDRQIRDTFKNCNLKKEVVQAKSGEHLLKLIKEKDLSVITTLVHKFETASRKKVSFVDDDQDIFVLVDEAHRTQNGMANLEMNRIIPNACYIGFTGTPLMKKEKESWRKFGDYIDKYTIDNALEDKIILPLIYEGRYVKRTLNANQIDRHMDRVSEDMSRKYNANVDVKHKQQLQRQITAKVIESNPRGIEEIARDIEKHYTEHFQGTGLKAQIVAPSKYAAVLFQQFFEKRNLVTSAVVISDDRDMGESEDIHKKEVVEYLKGIKEKQGSISRYEKVVIDSFKYSDEGIELIIVVDKLLTGFDAPRNTVLYLAKDLRDHNLLQAIARVNRLHENKKLPKTAGFIIDYSENAKNIDTAMKLFGNYDTEDVKGALIDVSKRIQDLEKSYAQLHDIFKEVQTSNDDEAFLGVLKEDPKREKFYKTLAEFIKNLNECFVLQDFVHEFRHLDTYKRELKKFMELRKTASLIHADRIDLSEYKQSLIGILDRYVDADGIELLTKQINITDREQFEETIETLGTDKSKAEAIAAQTQKTIHERMDTDPEFYERFSKKVSEILAKMREGKLADIEALSQLKLVQDDVINKKDAAVPESIVNNPGADVFYRNLREHFEAESIPDNIYIDIVLGIFHRIKKEAIVDWYKNVDVKRRIMNEIDDYLYDEVKIKKGVELTDENIKKIISNTLTLAENNYEIFI